MVVGLARCWFGCGYRHGRLGRRRGPSNESKGSASQHHDHAIAPERYEHRNADEGPAGNDPTSDNPAGDYAAATNPTFDNAASDHPLSDHGDHGDPGDPDRYPTSDNPTSDNPTSENAGDHITPTRDEQQPGFLRRRMRREAADGSVESGHTCT